MVALRNEHECVRKVLILVSNLRIFLPMPFQTYLGDAIGASGARDSVVLQLFLGAFAGGFSVNVDGVLVAVS